MPSDRSAAIAEVKNKDSRSLLTGSFLVPGKRGNEEEEKRKRRKKEKRRERREGGGKVI